MITEILSPTKRWFFTELWVADRIPISKIEIIESAGYNAFEERPKEFTDLVRNFMENRNLSNFSSSFT
jgi:hypothetical protein